MNKKFTTFILAAGLGERLRPITNHIPKPLLPILGKPLLEHVIERISSISDGKIGINIHYKADMLRKWIRNSPFSDRIEIFYENLILGTGGALKNAEDFLSKGHFLVHNSDIVSNIDFSLLIDTHLSEGNIATLAVHDCPRYNNVVLDENGYFIDVENVKTLMHDSGSERKKVAYTGIAVYSPEILKFIPSGFSHVTSAWLLAAKSGYKLRALDFTGSYWSDIGTPQVYASSVVYALRVDGETLYIHPSVKDCSDIEIDGYVVIERDCSFNGVISLRNCIALDGSQLKKKRYENCIIGPDFEIKLSEKEMYDVSEDVILIGTGGSDRRYYRQKSKNQVQDKNTVVVVSYQQGDPDFYHHIEYTKFFKNYKVPVPELLEFNLKDMTAIFEDLGDISLYSWLKCKRDETQIKLMYQRVIDIAVCIHSIPVERALDECPLLQQRIFDYDHFRWETSYFIERFVKQLRGIEIEDITALNEEFHKLAQSADFYSKTVIHRDFQAQNIMITKGIPRLIDYQGARIGPPAYDIASILWDPYFRLAEDMRERLCEYYLRQMEGKFDRDDFLKSLLLCRLQRHMQALGAYSFLSMQKGKKYFLKHIQEGLRILKEDIRSLKVEYPKLFELIEML